MQYYFQKTLVNSSFDEAIEKVTAALGQEGFGILTEIDVQATFKKKLNVDFPKYRILGACNPGFAYKALQSEINIGSMLPCNVVVMENDDKSISISIVDPVASLMAIESKQVKEIADEVKGKLLRVMENL